ncbi:MAG: hypothetical protein IKR83_01480 [Bacteroidales bacterium]|nr:hypothetical protein [Bacteroidales bacterium]
MTRKHTLIILLLLAFCTAKGQPYWNNLEMYRLNKVQPHDRIIPDGNWRMCLNGTWRFAYFDTPDEATLNPRKWDTIRVPGNIELQGFGVPVYVNMRNEFPSNPPYAPIDYNPTGVYARDFNLPAAWQGRRTIVKFGAVKSAMYLYINGREVGYSQDSKTPAEWDITKYLQAGRNNMAVKVVRWCDGSYLECQDMWRMSGITRDVEIYSVPYTYITDIKVIADLDTNDWRTGLLDVTVDLNREVSGGRVEISINDIVLGQHLKHNDWFAGFQMRCPNIQPWSDSTPALYTLTVSLLDDAGRPTERITKKIGFRHLDIRDGQARINGHPIEIRGVNRHEHSMYGGHYITPDEMRQDIALMKEMGINAVRTSHYPNDELWYDLCDSAGIYVWDEANVESHAQGYGANSLAKKKEWLNPILDRIYNMYKRDRNHPCVVAWSLGNECGNGYCFEEAYRFLKGKDNTRPVVYERAELDRNTDIVSVMYPSLNYLSRYANNPRNKRPYIIAEYCHAMGNSMGGLKDYWDTIDKYPQLQGGFIWDWIDQAFWRDCWVAGGDLGKLPDIKDDDAFCANGILAADRTPHACADEVEAVFTRGRNNVVVPATSSVKYDTRNIKPLVKKSRWRLLRDRHNITIESDDGASRVKVNNTDGSITSFVHHGQELLARPLRCNFWRPPTENDLADIAGSRAWQGLDRLQTEMLYMSSTDNEVVMLMRLTSDDGNHITVKQIIGIDAEGAVQLHYLVMPMGQFHTLPKLGIQMGLDTNFAAGFYGNIHETYPDRRTAQRVSTWYKSLKSLAERQYVVPQEQGNHEAQWVSFVRGGIGLAFLSPDDQGWLNFSVRRQEDSVLTAARRWCDVEDADHYIVNIDYRQAGLGTASCGPGVAEKYQINGDSTYYFRFLMIPTDGKIFLNPAGYEIKRHPELMEDLPADEDESRLPIHSITCSRKPAEQYGKEFPMMLADGRRAIPGDYRNGWAGFEAADTVEMTIALAQFAKIGEISVGACHSPNDWVVQPVDVQAQWSIDGKKWSNWQSLELQNPPDDEQGDSRRLRYFISPHKAKYINYIRLRFVCMPELPVWHNYSRRPAWLMIDEVDIRRR